LMDTVIGHVTQLNHGVADFEDAVFNAVEQDPEISTRNESTQTSQPARLAKRLQKVLNTDIPQHVKTSKQLTGKYGRPSWLVRYWLPATALLLSSTTIYRLFANRRAEIIEWIRNFGETVQDFWLNWVLEPTKKVIATIRHDKDSELALMSKESLKGDRDSLERMVVDFASEHPDVSVGHSNITESQIAEIRAKVKEGDLTPVLKAYERDLRKPFVGAVKGDLIRTLLIQVQKTKVDVEIAMSGIDSLLKSQELVFGFVGLTPGVLVCFAAFRYLGGAFGSRKGLRKGRKGSQSIRVLRNIDRVLAQATPTDSGVLSYKDHGLLLCEVHDLRKRAHGLFPGEIEREFLEDVQDLSNINSGVQAQMKVLERIRWGYSKWLQA
jgi:nuclear-control-of-ATPase protein 2